MLVPKSAGGETWPLYTLAGPVSWWTISTANIHGGASLPLKNAMDLWYIPFPVLGNGSAAKHAGISASDGSVVLAIASLAPGSTEAARIAALRTSVAQAVEWWLRESAVVACRHCARAGRGRPEIRPCVHKLRQCYDHSRHTFGPDANIEPCISSDPAKGANAHTVAHGWGTT